MAGIASADRDYNHFIFEGKLAGSWLKAEFQRQYEIVLGLCPDFPCCSAIVLLIGAATNWIDLSAFNLKSFILAFCSTLLINFIINIFEETAWRGYLTSQLAKLNLSDLKLYLVVACVWTLWHLPYYLVFLPEADIRAVMPVSRVVYVVVAFTTFLAWTVMFTELFRATKSVWPCVILHTVEDSLINHLVISGYISIATGREIFISPINGIITSILYVAVGIGIRAYRKQSNNDGLKYYIKP